MAGHSKWANIQHRKKAQDARRNRLFTVLIREISSATRVGGSDNPDSNPRLRLAVDKALGANMSKDIINRAIKRGRGDEAEGDAYEEIRYEGFAPGGVALMVDCLSDNRKRTVAEVRHVFARFNGNLGQSGSVSHLFRQRGILSYTGEFDEEALWEAALEMDVDDVHGDSQAGMRLLLAPARLFAVKDALEKKGFVAESAAIEEKADAPIKLEGDQANTLARMLDALSDLDDVQSVYSNADLYGQRRQAG